jgi:hypothetical protein
VVRWADKVFVFNLRFGYLDAQRPIFTRLWIQISTNLSHDRRFPVTNVFDQDA